MNTPTTTAPAYTVPAAQKPHPNTSLGDYMNVGPDPGPAMSEMERSAFTILSMGGMPLAQAKAEARNIAKIKEPERFAEYEAAQAAKQNPATAAAPEQTRQPVYSKTTQAFLDRAAQIKSEAASRSAAAATPRPVLQAPPLTKQEKMDRLALAMAQETAPWIGSAKSQKEMTKAADTHLSRKIQILTPSERSAVAALAAEGVEHFQAEERAKAKARVDQASGDNPFIPTPAGVAALEQLRAVGWTPQKAPGTFNAQSRPALAAAATSPTTAVDAAPGIDAEEQLELAKLRSPNPLAAGALSSLSGVGAPQSSSWGKKPGIFRRLASMFGG